MTTKLKQAIEEALSQKDYHAVAELAKALAATRNADNIEKTLTVFKEMGEALKKSAEKLDPEQMMKIIGGAK